ncbi:unnamed protein product [Ectocarpus sp. 8 AP-2014]
MLSIPSYVCRYKSKGHNVFRVLSTAVHVYPRIHTTSSKTYRSMFGSKISGKCKRMCVCVQQYKIV